MSQHHYQFNNSQEGLTGLKEAAVLMVMADYQLSDTDGSQPRGKAYREVSRNAANMVHPESQMGYIPSQHVWRTANQESPPQTVSNF